MQVYTDQYQFAHGKAPRGQGSWAFFPNSAQRIEDAKFFHGAYGWAKQQAVAWAKANGWRQVVVGS